jgi:hypothetical protein
VNLAAGSASIIGLVHPTPLGASPAPPRLPVTWWWFLVPLFSCGMGSFIMVLLGGIRLRSRTHIAAAVGYFVLAVYFFVGVQYVPSSGGSLPDAAIIPAFLIIWLGGLAHVLVLQMLVRRAAPEVSLAPRTAPAADPAIVAAQWRLQRREEARRILATDPALAAELRIGRPDLPRQYDDGGLVDVNHVPAAVLAKELDLPMETAAALARQRDRVGGFSSPEDLMVYGDGLTPERLQIIQQRLAFVPL